MESKETGIYKLVHSAKPKYCYIGSTSQGFKTRWKGHLGFLNRNKHHSGFLQNVVNKYGISGLKMEILEVSDVPKEELRVLEQKYIDNYIEMFGRKYLYNVTTTTRCSTDDPEIMLRQKKAAYDSGKSDRNVNRLRSYHANPEMNDKRVSGIKAALCVSVLCYETGQVFESFSDAKRHIISLGLSNNMSIGGIRDACNNPNRTAFGFHWQLVDRTGLTFNYEEEYAKESERLRLSNEAKIKIPKVKGAKKPYVSRRLPDHLRVPRSVVNGKIGKAAKERWANPEFKEKMCIINKQSVKKKRKPIVCVEENITFESVISAKDWLVSIGFEKADNSALSRCARGVYDKVYGYHWRFVEVKQIESPK